MPTIRIHDDDWELEYVRGAVEEARGMAWVAAECRVAPEDHRHCLVCWWVLYDSPDAERVASFRCGDRWLCRECHERFVANDELDSGRS
jgi:hypothetical protein